MKQKIFCVGLNKTGTSSLHLAFKALGFRSVHCLTEDRRNIKHIIKSNYDHGRDILEGISEYDVILDWDLDDSSHYIFKQFDRCYPGSKFILNTRDMEAWLKSRVKHYEKKRERIKTDPSYNQPWPEINKVKWRYHYQRHHKAVREYFKSRPEDLLVFDISKGHGYKEICEFLDLPRTRKIFPLVNTKNSIKKMVKSKSINFLNRFL